MASYLLLEDGVSRLLLEDGSGALLLEVTSTAAYGLVAGAGEFAFTGNTANLLYTPDQATAVCIEVTVGAFTLSGKNVVLPGDRARTQPPTGGWGAGLRGRRVRGGWATPLSQVYKTKPEERKNVVASLDAAIKVALAEAEKLQETGLQPSWKPPEIDWAAIEKHREFTKTVNTLDKMLRDVEAKIDAAHRAAQEEDDIEVILMN